MIVWTIPYLAACLLGMGILGMVVGWLICWRHTRTTIAGLKRRIYDLREQASDAWLEYQHAQGRLTDSQTALSRCLSELAERGGIAQDDASITQDNK